MNLLIMHSYLASCHFLPLRYKYSPQHPVLKHPNSVFFHWCKRLSFTPIQTTGKILRKIYQHTCHLKAYVSHLLIVLYY
jgi:hypothetical protein